MKKIRVMIVSLPGTWQRVLQKNIESYSFVEVVDSVNGSLSASRLLSQHKPDLVLIDSSIDFDDVVALIQEMKQGSHQTRSIVITDTSQQRRRIAQAGADFAVSSYNFETHIDEILHQVGRLHSDGMDSSETAIQTDPNPLK